MKKLFYYEEDKINNKKHKVLNLFGVKLIRDIKSIGGKSNKVCIKTNNGQKFLSKNEIKKLNIIINVSGSDNIIELDESVLVNARHFKIYIRGNKNKIKINHVDSIQGGIDVSGNQHLIDIENAGTLNISIVMGTTGYHENCYLKIGKNVTCIGLSAFLYQSNTSIEIGKDCLFADDTILQSSDGHEILDYETGELLNNKPYKIEIGNHVWIGRRASILKGAKIPSNSIIGYNSVVTGSFDEEHTVIAGIPAKIIKRGVDWNSNTVF
ncbi:acyltransferase [bacterium]|nr:acyltransferase [bacterium]